MKDELQQWRDKKRDRTNDDLADDTAWRFRLDVMEKLQPTGDEAMEKLLTLDDLAEYLSITYQSAWRLTKPKYTKTPIPTIKVANGKSVRIHPDDLAAWLGQYKRNALD